MVVPPYLASALHFYIECPTKMVAPSFKLGFSEGLDLDAPFSKGFGHF